MGANTFMIRATGATALEAFAQAVSDAKYDYGHRGYTGTIAEKHEFTIIAVPNGTNPIKYAQELIDKGDERIDNKWGPAGCIELGNATWLFFGWASS